MKYIKNLTILFLFCVTFITKGQQTIGENDLYYPGQYYVKYKSISKNLSNKTNANVMLEKELPNLYSKLGNFIQSVEQPFFMSNNLSIHYVYKIELKKAEQSIQFTSILKEDTTIEYFEPIPINRKIYTTNDPGNSSLYHLDKVGAKLAWDHYRGVEDVVVAVVDDAVQTNHPDLAQNCLPGRDVADGDNDPNPPNIEFDHGTHVAGIVGAVNDNNIGVASVGFNKVKILPVKSSNSPYSISHAYQGVIWAANNGAQIINMSWGSSAYSQTNETIINDAYNNGVILVAAAGNSYSSSLLYPAAYSNVVSVASLTSTDAKSDFSSYGSTVDISAPGSSIYSTIPYGTYASYSGTSMASPLVASCIAFVKSNFPSLNRTEIMNLVYSKADNIDAMNPSFINQLGAGRINVNRILDCGASRISIQNARDTTLCIGQTLTLRTNSTQISGFEWYRNNFPYQPETAINDSLVVNTEGKYKVKGLNPNCQNLFSQEINVKYVPLNLTISTPRNPIICSDTISVSAISYPGILYKWYLNDRIYSTGVNLNRLTLSETGNIKLVLILAGCDSLVSNSINITGFSNIITPITNQLLCPNQSITLRSSSTTSGLKQWKRDGVYVGQGDSLQVSLSGVYSLEFTTSQCGVKMSNNITITALPNTLSLSNLNNNICSPSQTVTLLSDNYPNVIYNWYRNNQLINDSQTATLTTNSGGQYKVQIQTPLCTLNSNALTISEFKHNLTILGPQSISICGNNSSIMKVDSFPSNSKLSWFKDNILISSTLDHNLDSLNSVGTGIYTARLEYLGCVVNSNNKNISNSPVSINIITTSTPLICGNTGSLNLSTSYTGSGFSYEWKRNNVVLTPTLNGITVSDSGQYSVRLYNQNCSVTSPNLKVNKLPNPIINGLDSYIFCTPTTITLTANQIPFSQNKWYKNNVEIPGQTTNSLTTSEYGNFKITSSIGSCLLTSNAKVISNASTQNSLPTNPQNDLYCTNENRLPLLKVDSLISSSISPRWFEYTGGIVSYDGGGSSGPDPTVTVANMRNVSKIMVKVTYRKTDGTCQTPQFGSPYNSEMSLKIKSPNNTEVTLIPTNYYTSGTIGGLVTAIFEDSLNLPLPSNYPTSGTFRPFQSFQPFNGIDANGIWTLIGYDDVGADPLCIHGFELYVESRINERIVWWSDSTSYNNPLSQSHKFNPLNRNPGTFKYYAQKISGVGCFSERIPATLTIKPPITPAPFININEVSVTSDDSINICMGDTVILKVIGCESKNIIWNDGVVDSVRIVVTNIDQSYTAKCIDQAYCTPTSIDSNLAKIKIEPLEHSLIHSIGPNKISSSFAHKLSAANKIHPESKVEYKGLNSVLLNPGFEVSGGHSFKAFIGPCKNE